jgi:Domain of unknown function (DUF4166)/Saccharopine dehydrogenase NADP binding domain
LPRRFAHWRYDRVAQNRLRWLGDSRSAGIAAGGRSYGPADADADRFRADGLRSMNAEWTERPPGPLGRTSDGRFKVLILGGYGTFGGRLAELLCDEQRLNLVIAGRSRAKAEALCEALPGKAAREAWAVNRDRGLDERLAEIAPDIVVDASGPFQRYGDDPYRVAEAALAVGADYVDLADGSEFVRNIGELDRAARAAGRFVLSGASSFPVLTAAAARHLARGLAHVDSITAGIAPSPYAGVGKNVIRAIAGYAGKPIEVRRSGKTRRAYALTETRRATIAPPGAVPLAPLDFSLVDVPDLMLLPELWPGVRTVWAGAAPVPAVLHRLLRWLAHGVRRRLIPSLVPLAPLMHAAVNWLRWGEHRGGMFVAIQGRTPQGARVTRSWHLVAEGDDGPLIPSMAVETIVRQILAGRTPVAGARPAARALELDDYERAFARRDIAHGVRQPVDGSLFKRVLGEAWGELPYSLQKLHGATAGFTASGHASVERGRNPVAQLIARLFKFPPAGDDIPLKVRFEVEGDGERWRRSFGKDELESTLYGGRGKFAGLICERFGAFVFGMALVVENGRLEYVVRRWSWRRIPLPRALAPRGEAYEHEIGGRFHFQVEIAVPLFGPVVTYDGHLE